MLSDRTVTAFLTRYPISGMLYVGYSGGIDSHVLLHLLAGIDALKPKINAVYVNHGLQLEATQWAEHCRQISSDLAVPFIELAVNAQPKAGQSPEDAAREARYQALKPLLKAGDALLIGQHEDDQLETVLLQLARGAGIQGLSAMSECASFGAGKLLRPLLTISKIAINAYAAQHQLQWIEDASNYSDQYERNYLRRQIIPIWKKRWPELATTVSRSARHCAEAQTLLAGWQEQAIKSYFNPAEKTLRIPAPDAFSPIQLKALVRKWLQLLDLKPPSEAVLLNLIKQVINARADSMPKIVYQNHVLTRYRNKLYCLSNNLPKSSFKLNWPASSKALQIATNNVLFLRSSSAGIDKKRWHCSEIIVKSRSGGETITTSCRHTLKNLFQEAGIPPWERQLMPLIYLDGKLAAVANLWIDRWAWTENGDCYRIKWRSGESSTPSY